MQSRLEKRRARQTSFGWGDRLGYRLLVASLFMICLVTIPATRLMRLLSGRRGTGSETIIAEARSSAHAAAGYAFIA